MIHLHIAPSPAEVRAIDIHFDGSLAHVSTVAHGLGLWCEMPPTSLAQIALTPAGFLAGFDRLFALAVDTCHARYFRHSRNALQGYAPLQGNDGRCSRGAHYLFAAYTDLWYIRHILVKEVRVCQ